LRLLLAKTCLAAALVAAGALPAASAEVNVTCGDQFKGTGFLTGDCTGTITILKGSLSLQGFTVQGAGLAAVECIGTCRVFGPGSIVSAGSTFGISGEGAVLVSGVTIQGHGAVGVRGGDIGRVRIDESVITGNGVGVRGARIKISNSEIDANSGSGIVATTRGVKLDHSYVRDNGGDGVATVLNNPEVNRVKGYYMYVTGNGRFGVLAKNMSTSIAIIRNNRQDPACGDTDACADVGTIEPPHIKRTGCDTSMQIPEQFSGPVPFGPDWDVCDLD
jgi:hypothetical protein